MFDRGNEKLMLNLALTVLLSVGCALASHAAEDLTGLVDPTAPLNMNASETGGAAAAQDGQLLSNIVSFELNSVLIRSNDRLAVVNDKRVRVGDRVGTARVAAINNDGVVLEINGETRTLALFGEQVKTLVAAGQAQ